MSQQSTLKMMLPYFDKWMKELPRLEDLAAASEEKVLKLWEGLGYYSRARNLHKTASLLSHGFPQSPEELIKLPGIGPYTAAAIASISFDHPTLPVDGNVIRVLSRLFLIRDPLNQKADLEKINEASRSLALSFPLTKRGALAQAFMELGALVCRPGTQARCFECPLKKHCEAYRHDQVASLPAVKIRPQMLKVSRLLLLYRNKQGAPLLRKIPVGQVLGGQWELPHLDLGPSDKWVSSEFSRHFELKKPLKHTIMHRRYTLWPVEVGQFPSKAPLGHMFLDAQFGGTLTTATRKCLAAH